MSVKFATMGTVNGCWLNPLSQPEPLQPSFSMPSRSVASELVNQTLQGRIFVQLQPDGPVWYSPDGEAVALSIQSAGDGEFTGTITQGRLVSTENNQSQTFTGKVATKAATFVTGTSYVGAVGAGGTKWWSGWTTYVRN